MKNTFSQIGALKQKNLSIGMILMQARTFIALFLLTIAFTIILGERGINFLAPINLITITKHVAITAILGIGMTFVILTGGIDLSVGSIVGLCGMIAGGLINEGVVLPMFGITIYFQVWVIILIAAAIGTLIGLVNGILIARFNVAPFIGTLGIMYIARGFANIRSGGATFPNLQGDPSLGNTGFPFLGAGKIIGIPVSIWILVLLLILAVYVARKTPLGRHIYAIGGNSRAAELSGVKVKRVTMLVYAFSGFCSALVGLIIASQLVASHPATGESYELSAIAAVVLGGTSLDGGIGSVGGTIIGAFVIGILGDGLVMMGVSEFWQNVIKGVVIIAAVIFDQLQQRMKSRAAVSSPSVSAVIGEETKSDKQGV
ncbi:ABC transporter permease [Marispirochaeta sp.]|uniref:ABC transporter permease n=1 Tax=Marispirochaeta sp. TaxID=2038653 RepID=UPI0029C96E2A|nr:ABC transporter permease [Marispirochaeta sp.]